MGCILGPMAFFLFCAFIPGIILGKNVIRVYSKNLLAIAFILGFTMIFLLVTFGLPFLVHAKKMVTWDFVFMIFMVVGGLNISCGVIFWILFSIKKKPIYGLFGSSLFFTAGFIPVVWFSFADWFMKTLKITFQY